MNWAYIVQVDVTCFEHGLKLSGSTKVEFLDQLCDLSTSAVLRVVSEVSKRRVSYIRTTVRGMGYRSVSQTFLHEDLFWLRKITTAPQILVLRKYTVSG